MPGDRPEELKGWPKSWYVNGNEDGDLKCPAVGCNKVFHTVEEVKNLLHHTFLASQNPDTDFHHEILRAMCKVMDCPKCGYCQFPLENPLGIINSRELFKHERGEHHSEELSDVKQFIALIRQYRHVKFGGGPQIWPKVYEYYKRNIRKQRAFRYVEDYLKDHYLFYQPKIRDWHLDHIAREDRWAGLPAQPDARSEEDKKKHEECYPVGSDEFLSSLECLEDGSENRRFTKELAVLRDKYSNGDF